jgi:hypothetical protein
MRRQGWGLLWGVVALAVGAGLFHVGAYPPATGPEESMGHEQEAALERAAEEGARRDELAAEAVAHHRTEARGLRGWLRRLRSKA